MANEFSDVDEFSEVEPITEQTQFEETAPVSTNEFSSVDEFGDVSDLSYVDQMNLINNTVDEAAVEYGLDPNLLHRIINQESGYNPNAVSRAGAKGLMQLMPNTANDMGVSDPFDVRQNIFGGAGYLRKMLDRYGQDVNLALQAYNAGPTNVDKYNGNVPFKETQNYVAKILSNKQYANTVFVADAPKEMDEFSDVPVFSEVEEETGDVTPAKEDPLRIRPGAPIDDMSAREKEREAARQSELDKINKSIENAESSNLPNKRIMLEALERRKREIEEQPFFDDRNIFQRIYNAVKEGIKPTIPDHTASFRQGAETKIEMYKEFTQVQNMEDVQRAIKDMGYSTDIQGDAIQFQIIRDNIMHGDKTVSEEEASVRAVRELAKIRIEQLTGDVVLLKKIEDAEIFKPDSEIRKEMEQRGSTLDEVIQTAAGTSAEVSSFFINPLFGAVVTYNRLKGATTRDIEERLNRNIDQINANRRDKGLPILSDRDRQELIQATGRLSAGLQLPTEALSSLIKIKSIMGATSFGRFIRGAINSYVGESATEFVQQYEEEAAIMWALNRDLSPTELISFMLSKEPEIRARAKHAGHIGGLTGLLTQGIGGSVRLASQVSLMDYISPKQRRINEQHSQTQLDERRRVQEEELSQEDANVRAIFDMFESPDEKTLTQEIAERTDEVLNRPTSKVKVPHKESITQITKRKAKKAAQTVMVRFFDRVAPIKDISREAYRYARVYPGRMDSVGYWLDNLRLKMGPLEGRETFWDGWIGSKRAKWRAEQGMKNPNGVTLEQANHAIEALTYKWARQKHGADFDVMTPEGFNRMQQAEAELMELEQQWSDFFWQHMVEDGYTSGIYSQEEYLNLLERKRGLGGEFYAAFDIIEKHPGRFDPQYEPQTVAAEGVRQQQVGTELKADYPTDGSIKKFIRLQGLYERNKVVSALVTDQQALQSGTVRPIVRKGKGAKKRFEALQEAGLNPVMEGSYDKRTSSEITRYNDGVREWYLVDNSTADAISNMSSATMVNFLQWYNAFFRRTATVINPGFVATNAVRDGYLSYTASPVHSAFQPHLFIKDWISGLQEGYKGTFRVPDDPLSQDIEAKRIAFEEEPLLWRSHNISGGGFGWTRSEIKEDLKGTENFLKEINARKTKMRSGKSGRAITITRPDQWLKLLEQINESVEYAPRLAIRKRILQNLTSEVWNDILLRHTGMSHTELMNVIPEVISETQIGYQDMQTGEIFKHPSQVPDGHGFREVSRKNPDIWRNVNENVLEMAVSNKLEIPYFPNARTDAQQAAALKLKQQIVSDVSTKISFMVRQAGIDFNAGGTWIKAANQIKPFLNARVQGAVTQLRALFTKPEASTMKYPRANAWAKFTAINIMPTMAAFAMSKITDPGDEMRQDIPDYIKKRYWIIPLGWAKNERGINEPIYVQIPKGEIGVYSNPLELWLFEQYKKDPKVFDYIKEFIDSAHDSLSPITFLDDGAKPSMNKLLSNLPPAALLFTQSTSNTDFYRGRQIETAGMQNLLPYERYNERTPQVYKDFSKFLYDIGARGDWISPVRLQKMAEDIGTIYGREAAGLEEFNMLRRIIQGVEPTEEDTMRGFRTLLVAAAERQLRMQGGAINQKNWELINETENDLKKVISDAKAAVKKGNRGEANRLITMWNIGVKTRLQEVDVNKLRSLGYKIRGNKGLRNAFMISTTERRNILRGREDERESITKKIVGRR